MAIQTLLGYMAMAVGTFCWLTGSSEFSGVSLAIWTGAKASGFVSMTPELSKVYCPDTPVKGVVVRKTAAISAGSSVLRACADVAQKTNAAKRQMRVPNAQRSDAV